MNIQSFKAREEWKALNLKINSLIRTTELNRKSGVVPSEEFVEWLNALIARRDSLTPLVP